MVKHNVWKNTADTIKLPCKKQSKFSAKTVKKTKNIFAILTSKRLGDLFHPPLGFFRKCVFQVKSKLCFLVTFNIITAYISPDDYSSHSKVQIY